MRVEAREPILDRMPSFPRPPPQGARYMPLAYNLAWRATSARPPSARRGAHVSERFAGRAIPVLSNASPAPRLPAVPSRESPSSRVPSALPSSACRFGWRHPLVEGSPADGCLSRTGEGRARDASRPGEFYEKYVAGAAGGPHPLRDTTGRELRKSGDATHFATDGPAPRR